MTDEAPPCDQLPVPKKRRRRHTAAFKAQILAECDQPGASVAGVAIRHQLNPNMVQRWRWLARRGDQDDFLRLPSPVSSASPTVASATRPAGPATVRMEVPISSGTLIVHWPIDSMVHSVDWLRALTR
jgi:transposase